MMQGVNMMSVVLYNTAHELIAKVNKISHYKVLKNRYKWTWHPQNLFWTYLYTLQKKLSSVNYDSSIYRIIFCVILF